MVLPCGAKHHCGHHPWVFLKENYNWRKNTCDGAIEAIQKAACKKKSVAYNSSLGGVHSLHLPGGLCDLASAGLHNLLSSVISAPYALAALTAVLIFSLLFCLLFCLPVPGRLWKALVILSLFLPSVFLLGGPFLGVVKAPLLLLTFQLL